MLGILLVVLIILWILGYITIPGIVIPAFPLFFLNGHPVTLWDLLVFAVIVWVAGIMPSPLREIIWVIVILWILAALGILAFAGLSTILILAVIIGLLLSLFHAA